MPALRHPHDCDRGLRARLRAAVAVDPKQDRHIMNQTASERRHVLAPLHWLHAGGDLSRYNHANQRADRPSIRSTRSPRCPLHASRPPLHTPSRLHRASFAPTIMAGAIWLEDIDFAPKKPLNRENLDERIFSRLNGLAFRRMSRIRPASSEGRRLSAQRRPRKALEPLLTNSQIGRLRETHIVNSMDIVRHDG